MRLLWSPAALEDRDAIVDWIALDRPDAALRLDLRIEAQADLLVEHALLGRPGCIAGTRELIIDRTPYLVVYTVRTEVVHILRVIHGARRWPTSLP